MTARGIRNRNPGNIVWTGTPLFPGEIGPEPEGTFAQFDTVENGIRAIALNLTAYQDRHGLNTVDGIIRRWSTTDQDAYVAAVSTALGVAPDQAIDVHSPSIMAPLVGAIIRQENGEQPFDVAAILAGSPAAAPESPAAAATPPQATLPLPQSTGGPMGGIGLILGLLQTLLPVFSPGAQAKIAPVLSGLTGQPVPVGGVSVTPDDKTTAILAFVNQMMQTVLAASGHANPAGATDAEKVAATAAVIANPALAQTVEADALARLDKMGPTFDRLAASDKAANEAAILGRDAAAARGRMDAWDMTKSLVWSSEGLIWFTMALLCAAVLVQIVMNDSHEPSGVLVGMIGPLLMMIYKNRSQPFDYRFDGTPSSNAASAINAEIARKQ